MKLWTTCITYLQKNIISVIAFIIFVIVANISLPIIPDFLELHKVKPDDYFNILIGSTASILGILIAVVLLTFELMKHNSLRRQKESILNHPTVIRLISLAVTIIILSLISYVFVESFEAPTNNTIGYFLGWLFVFFIITIFPSIRNILRAANNLENVLNQIDQLTEGNFKEIKDTKNGKFKIRDNNLELIRIRYELINYVRECDFEAYSAILDRFNKKIIDLMGDGKNRDKVDDLLECCDLVWSGSNQEALRVGNYQYFDNIWECLQGLYTNAANKKISLLHYKNLELFTWTYLRFLTRNKLGDSLSTGFNTLRAILSQNLKLNCPKQTEVKRLYRMFNDNTEIAHNIDKNLHWDHLMSILSSLNQIQRYAIQEGDKELFSNSNYQLEFLAGEVVHGYIPNLGEYQEAAILIRIFSFQTNNLFIVDYKNLHKEFSEDVDSCFQLMSDIIGSKKFFSQRLLQDISDFLIKGQRIGILNRWNLNNWGLIGRSIGSEYDANPLVPQIMYFIVNTLNQLKKEIEENQLPAQTEMYNEVKSQLDSMIHWIPNTKSTALLRMKINSSVIDFKEVSGIVDFKIVSW